MTMFDLINPDYLHESPQYAIAATHRVTGQRYLIKVSSLATREDLILEIRRMNQPTARRPQFMYTLTTEGALV